jgi:hypothetical protein
MPQFGLSNAQPVGTETEDELQTNSFPHLQLFNSEHMLLLKVFSSLSKKPTHLHRYNYNHK